jgi:hypothetical protein
MDESIAPLRLTRNAASRRSCVGLPPAVTLCAVTRAEAEERARSLQENDPARETHRFVPRETANGEWEIARVEVPAALRRGALTESIEARPRPPTADDPRTGNERRLPGLPGGV